MKPDMKYSFASMEEPTEEQLAQIMREACEDAMAKHAKAMEEHYKKIAEEVAKAKAKYLVDYGAA